MQSSQDFETKATSWPASEITLITIDAHPALSSQPGDFGGVAGTFGNIAP